MAPQTRGAQLLYDTFINPFLTQHAAKFDPIFATTKLVSHSLLSVLPKHTGCNLLQSISVIECCVTGLRALLQAIDNAQVDKLVALAQQYGPEITRTAISQVQVTTSLEHLQWQRLHHPKIFIVQVMFGS